MKDQFASTETEEWNLIQVENQVKTSGWSCQVKRSTFTFMCGLWSYTKIMKIPSVDINVEVSTQMCSSLVNTLTFGLPYIPKPISIKLGAENIISINELGLIHTEHSTVSCEGQSAKIGDTVIGEVLELDQWRIIILQEEFKYKITAAGIQVGKTTAKIAAGKKGEEEGSKFGLDQGRKAGAAAARKLKDNEGKQIKEEGNQIAEKTGNDVGAKSGASAGEKAAADEASRLGGDEGERVGREIAGDEGARIGREVGAEAARQAGARHGRKVGKLAGVKAGLAAAKTACIEHAKLCTREISREKVTAMRKLFAEIASGAAQKAAMEAARAAVMKDIYEIAIRAAGRAAREKILAMASKGQIRLKSDWRPTSLIGVINGRSDLSDIEKVKLAAKSKMDSNISDLLPSLGGSMSHTDDPLVGKLKFNETANAAIRGDMETSGKKWKSVLITDMPEEKRGYDMSKDNVNSLKKRFETKNLKNNEAYVIM